MRGSLTSIIELVTDFWNWWSDEIMGMIPADLKAASDSRNHLDIFAYQDRVIIESVSKGNGQRLEENSILEKLDDDCWEDILHLSEKLPPRLFLSENDFHIINIKLPAKTLKDPHSAIALQLPLHSPLNINKIEWNYCKQSNEQGFANFAIFIVRAHRLDQIEMLFADHGAMPPTIAVNYGGNIMVFRQPLIMGQSFFENKKLMLRLASFLLLLSIPLSVILGANIITNKNQEYSNIIESEARPKIDAWRDAQYQENLRRRAIPLSGRKTIIPMLDELAKLLPENIWVHSISAQDSDNIIIRVNASNSARLKPILEKSQYFESVEIVDTQELDPDNFIHTVEIGLK